MTTSEIDKIHTEIKAIIEMKGFKDEDTVLTWHANSEDAYPDWDFSVEIKSLNDAESIIEPYNETNDVAERLSVRTSGLDFSKSAYLRLWIRKK